MKFDPYDYVGVIVPGTIMIVTIGYVFPQFVPVLQSSISIGDFGLVLILAFLAGHILQAAGNLFEWAIWWFAGGMPTCWVSSERTKLLSSSQLDRLSSKLKDSFGVDRYALQAGDNGPIREIVALVRGKGRCDRIDKFNRNYGLMRGAFSGFVLAGLLVLIFEPSFWEIAILLITAGGISAYRMVRFGIHYAREVYVEYLNLPEKA